MKSFDRVLIAALAAVNVVLGAATLDRVQALNGRIAELERRAPQAAPEAEPKRQAAPPAAEPKVQRAEFTAYAYCACEKCCGKWAEYGLTATGTVPVEGRTVAVDPAVIPLGTEIWIDGAGPYVAEDTGSGIDGCTLDVYFESHQAALEYGKREVTVEWKKQE